MLDFRKPRPNDVSVEEIVETLSDFDLQSGKRLWIAFSGGVDSTVLLHAAAKAFERSQLTVLHINHGMSDNAELWESHCKSAATRLGLRFVGRHISVAGKNLEFEGRRARFKVFKEVVGEGDIVATAHHRDDELESLMWQLGTGRALVGIATWRNLGDGHLWRPLLRFRREELQSIAQQNGWTWVEDESNLDISLTRNALRQEVLPRLRTAIPEFESHLLQLKVRSLEALPREPIEVRLLQENPIRVRAWLDAFEITPKTSVVEEILRQTTAREDAQVLVRVSPNASVRRYKGKMFVVSDTEPFASHSIRVGESRRYAFGKLTWLKKRVGLSPDVEIWTDTRDGGETLLLNDRCIRLSNWFYEQEVPPWERDAWPLLFSDKRLVAVPGLGVSAAVSAPGGWVPQWHRLDAGLNERT